MPFTTVYSTIWEFATNRNRVKDLLYEALALSPDERDAFLGRSCGGDSSLRAELESLLAAHAEAGDFGERPAIDRRSEAAMSGETDAGRWPAIAEGGSFGVYQIGARLGAGGMGEVYRAHDTTLQRDVAIKVLLTGVLADSQRRARFEREARILAALNHSNIASIYGFEEHDGVRGLVLELIEGPTLADRLRAGPIPIKEALTIARQIAGALDAAHEKGIIHRDLKPANVKITRDGIVKVLDFGLAKSVGGHVAEPDLSQVIPAGLPTQDGLLLGTVAYMSPEQARGKPVDKRSDVWALGCVLYEMLTGRMAFPDEIASDTIAAILDREPVWDALSASTPTAIRTLLRRCLEKDPAKRLRDIADARLEIEDSLAASESPSMDRPPRRHIRRIAWISALLALVVGGLAIVRLNSRFAGSRRQTAVARFVISLPSGEPLGTQFDADVAATALSPDGRYLAYVGGNRFQIYLRAIDKFEGNVLPGTENADNPFFSPDGKWLGFFANYSLKKVSVDGGAPTTICNLPGGAYGAAWQPDGTIVFAPARMSWQRSGLLRVSAAGGTPAPVTLVGERERGHRWPDVLPGGKAVLFSAAGVEESWSSGATIYVQSLDDGKRRALVKGVAPHYLPTGHLLYAQSDTLFAAPFDLATLDVSGPSVPVLDGIMQHDESGPQVSVSQIGSLAYIPAVPDHRGLVWVDRSGAERSMNVPDRLYVRPRVSPDSQRLAVVIQTDVRDLWIYDLAHNTLNRLTFEGENGAPLWTPDGRRVTFNSQRKPNAAAVFWKLADGSAPEEPLIAGDTNKAPTSWSPDGRVLAFAAIDPVALVPGTAAPHMWWLSLNDRKPHLFLQSKFADAAGVFSPDGRWLAYVSDESGRNEIYVRPFPGAGGKWQISTDGGNEPVWPRRGRELFYRRGNTMMAVDVTTSPSFAAGQPRRLFESDYIISEGFMANYDVTPDGDRFVMVKTRAENARAQIDVVLNWTEELKQRVPTR